MLENEQVVLDKLKQNLSKYGRQNLLNPMTKDFSKSYKYNFIKSLTNRIIELKLEPKEIDNFIEILVRNIIKGGKFVNINSPQTIIDVCKSIKKFNQSYDSLKEDLIRSHKNLDIKNLEKTYKSGHVSEYYISMSKKCMRIILDDEFISIDELFSIRKEMWKILPEDELFEIFKLDLIKSP